MDTRIVAEGLVFAEGPRWHDGALWFSDMYGETLYRLSPGNAPESVCKIAERPSGLGWLPGGDMIIVSMKNRQLLRRDAKTGALSTHADISALVPHHINDMVVDNAGRAYVGNFGFDLGRESVPVSTSLTLVDETGAARSVADELMFPNGMVISGDVLIVAETYGPRLTAFDIGKDGTLSGRRVWAPLTGGAMPDGICLDASGAVWTACPTTGEVLRIKEGGEVLERVQTARMAIACTLGGEDGKTLYVTTSESVSPKKCQTLNSARIEAVRVSVGSGGSP